MQLTGSTLQSERLFAASPAALFAAFSDPAKLARWWGPDGFTNTFLVFEFTPGGQWIFVMHGPDGTDYHNESVFRVIEPESCIVIEHVVQPWFSLRITLTPRDGGTFLTWEQEFESREIAEKLRPVCEPANEQNLNRLAAVLADTAV